MGSVKPSAKPTAGASSASAAFLAAIPKTTRLNPLLLEARPVVMTPE